MYKEKNTMYVQIRKQYVQIIRKKHQADVTGHVMELILRHKL